MRFTCALVVLFSLGLSLPVAAQRRVQYDTLAEETPAAASCGFCAGEKFGVVFRELSGGRGLRADEFPLTVVSLEVALASVEVQEVGGFGICLGSTTGGAVDTQIAIYAGDTPPSGDIRSFPPMGPWEGESLVWSGTVPIMRSVETTGGSMRYNLMFNTVELPDGGVRVEPPNTYLRAVVTIPTGSGSATCTSGGNMEPAAAAVRDNDGRIADEVNFIYAVSSTSAGAVPEGWHWNESSEIVDPMTLATTIQGDWGIRLNVRPEGSAGTDGGTPTLDAGAAVDAGSSGGVDSGTPPAMDAGAPPAVDAGGSTAMCAADADCAGGERCVEGMCRRVACTAATDCVGGMTCVEGRCRNLCTNDAECMGGEVCDPEAGHCVSVGTLEDGGCGCRVSATRTPAWPLAALPLLLGLMLRRRRSR
jgi:MYXO-CTERM domain-containing protein